MTMTKEIWTKYIKGYEPPETAIIDVIFADETEMEDVVAGDLFWDDGDIAFFRATGSINDWLPWIGIGDPPTGEVSILTRNGVIVTDDAEIFDWNHTDSDDELHGFDIVKYKS